MRMPAVSLAVLALLCASGGCAHTSLGSTSASIEGAAPSAAAPPVASAPASGEPDAPAAPEPSTLAQGSLDPAEAMIAEAGPNTTVLVMEADDFGGGTDVITAAPKRPSMPSFMTDIAMAPSR